MKIVPITKVFAFCSLFWAISISPAFGEYEENPQWDMCQEVLNSNCDATQEELLREFLGDLKRHSLDRSGKKYDGDAPALEALPKDKFGMPNWIKSVVDGTIRPRGNLTGEPEREFEGFFDNLIVMQVSSHFMADVVFPHGMHTYWLSCNSCHPKPFKKKIGSSNILMNEIMAGKWCGKCHGKVAFPPHEYTNCRRCHSISKDSLRKR